ncbi:MAG: AAA family ATPase [Gemmatimonadetes bacterium]|nr:AAA family ATPase [Gemmatimonadota bacterium]
MPPSRSPEAAEPGGSQPALLRTLGEARVLSPDGLRELLGPGKPLALLAYLACSPRQSATREHLVDLLWSDLEPDRGRHALRQTVWYLRQLFGTDALTGRGGELTLLAPIAVDRVEFLAAVERGDLLRAAELYQGDFLGGFAAPGSIEFEHWADVERQRLRSVFLRTAETVARQWLNAGRVREAQQLARRARDADPASESAWRLLFEAIQQGEDRLALTIEADQFAERMTSLGRTPEPATRILLARERRTDQGEPPAQDAPGLVAELIGREREFAAIVSGWQGARASTRHLHISAPAGLGKSRLLNDVAARLATLGARVVLLRANPGQREIPFSFLAELAGRLAELPGGAGISPATAGALVALNPTLSARYVQPADPATGAEALRRRCSAITELLEVVAEEQRLSLLLDDLHWLDPASRQALSGVLPTLRAPGALLVTAARPVPGAELGGEGTERLSLAPLTPEQVRALVTSLAALPPAPWAQNLPAALARSTGGSPLLVLETLQLVMDRGWLGVTAGAWHCEAPAELARVLEEGSALRHRLEELDANDRWVLALLAHAGIPLDGDTIVRTSGRPPHAVLEVLGRMEQRGFVHRVGDRWQPAHDEIAADALALTDPATSRAAHLGLGRALVDGAMVGRERLLRAGRHLEAAGAQAELSGLFARYLRLVRGQGDGRRVGEVAHEFLGDAAPPAAVTALVRGIPLWSRVRYSSGWVAAAALLAIGVALSGFLLFRPAPGPDMVLLFTAEMRLPRGRALRVDLREDGWRAGAPIDLRSAKPVSLPGSRPGVVEMAASPDGREWIFNRADTGATTFDLYLRTAAGAERRLTHFRGDDGGAAWAPDGKSIVFYSSQWSPPEADNYDLALMDLATGAVTHLTIGRSADRHARFSPDGTLVGFHRTYDDEEPAFCTVSRIGGRQPTCYRPAGYTATGFIGWLDSRYVLLAADAQGEYVLLRYDIATGATLLLEQQVQQVDLSPDGHWLAWLLEDPESGDASWFVSPVEDLSRRRQVFLPGSQSTYFRVWINPPQAARREAAPPILRSIRIRAPDTLRTGASYLLRVLGSDQRGRPTPVPAIRGWTSSDPRVVSVDTAGVALARDSGGAWVGVDVAGLLRDSVRLRVRPHRDSILFQEDWSAGISRQWIAFGNPWPSLARGPGDTAAFHNRGDGKFPSGAFTRAHWTAEGGLGMEVMVSWRITRGQWQIGDVSLVGGLDSALAGDWDFVTNAMPISDDIQLRSCGFAYPDGEGPLGRRRVWVGAGSRGRHVPVDSTLGDGAWRQVRIQIFEDGRCGFAINGRPVWLSRQPVPVALPFAIRLGQSSAGTEILHGPIVAWRGVRDDVQWDLLQDSAGTR